MEFLLVDVFADSVGTGATVPILRLGVDGGDGPSMQGIATALGFPDTAFLLDGAVAATPTLRIFTPEEEVHPSVRGVLAAGFMLLNGEDAVEITMLSSSGPQLVSRSGSTLATPRAAAAPSPSAMSVDIDSLDVPQPIETLRTDQDVILVLGDREAVQTAQPDLRAIAALHERGLVLTARGDDEDFVSRFFAPPNLAEDTVTASVNASLGRYWAERLGRTSLTARQLSRRGGLLMITITDGPVAIGGLVRPTLVGEIAQVRTAGETGAAPLADHLDGATSL